MESILFGLAIASFICAVICAVIAVILHRVLGVHDAINFLRNKKVAPSTRSKTKKRPVAKSRKTKPRITGSTKPTSEVIDKAGRFTKDNLAEVSGDLAEDKKRKKKKLGTGKLNEEAEDTEKPTSLLHEESEKATSLLSEDSEKPTSLLEQDESEHPTSLLQEETEKPTSLLQSDTESPTSVLESETETPTQLLGGDEATERTTSLLESEETEKPTTLLKEDEHEKSQDEFVTGNVLEEELDNKFKFKIVTSEIVVHTDEKIIE